MIQLFCDSASMISPAFANEHSIRVFPLTIELDGVSRLDQIEITSGEVLDAIRAGKSPHTSQPSVGEKLDAYNEALRDPETEIIDLCMADGLSGTWQSARMAADQCLDPSRVSVVNTRTLAGPFKKMVETADALRQEGRTRQEIVEAIEQMADREHSYLAIVDLDAITRSGRIPKAAAAAGNLFHLVPVVEKSEDGTRLNMHKVFRTMKKACHSMLEGLKEDGKGEDRTIYICHAKNEKTAGCADRMARELFPQAQIEILPLCSLFCVHGGPECIAIQAI